MARTHRSGFGPSPLRRCHIVALSGPDAEKLTTLVERVEGMNGGTQGHTPSAEVTPSKTTSERPLTRGPSRNSRLFRSKRSSRRTAMGGASTSSQGPSRRADPAKGRIQFEVALAHKRIHPMRLVVAVYILAHGENPAAEALAQLLERGNSPCQIGVRAGKTGIVQRVPRGAQLAADDGTHRSGTAGARLVSAWEELYRLGGNPSGDFPNASLAVEDASPLSPSQVAERHSALSTASWRRRRIGDSLLAVNTKRSPRLTPSPA